MTARQVFALVDCNNFYVSCERLFRPDLFAPAPRPGSEQLMAVMDKINAEFGRGTLRPGRVPPAPGWAMKQTLRSPGYISKWEDLPRIT
ncbi:MAG: Protein UmuC [Pseudomonas citronellolis]|nr:MAG: Protein UmuC [Pseudomonas citronellolis]